MRKQFVKWNMAGGSVMVRIPAEAVKLFDIRHSKGANVSIEDGRVIVEPVRDETRNRADWPKSYADLLARCNLNAAPDPFEDEWMDMPSIGKDEIK
jgi:antitoxin component of MazEF toxin-antitoxin module